MSKINVSVRLTPEATQILKELAKNLGVSQAAILEIALRNFVKESKENVRTKKESSREESHRRREESSRRSEG